MTLRSIKSIRSLRGKRVLLRCDLNIKIASGKIEQSDLWRLHATVPTIEYLLKKGASVILVSHRGRPHGIDHDLSLLPIVTKLASILHRKIPLWQDDIGSMAKEAKLLRPGSVVCLENIRFHSLEDRNDDRFAKQLATLADIYVNDAFANIHRSHASMVAVTRYLPSYAGLLTEYEVIHLTGILKKAKRPIVAIVGGNKISTKMRLLKRFMSHVDYVLLGGSLANNVLAALEYEVGSSQYEKDMVSWSKSLITNRLRLPVDVRVATSLHSRDRVCAVGAVGKRDMILDLGPETIQLYASIIRKAKTVIWNGPLGYFEDRRYARATYDMVKVLSSSKAQSYVGGGETVKAVLSLHAENALHFVSTGGGAMLAMLEGKPLPALRALMNKR